MLHADESDYVPPKSSPLVMRMHHDMRTSRLARQMPCFIEVMRRGYLAGKFGTPKSRCPVRDGPPDCPSHLHYAWMEGWGKGSNDFAKLREKPKPPRPDNRPRKRRRRVA